MGEERRWHVEQKHLLSIMFEQPVFGAALNSQLPTHVQTLQFRASFHLEALPSRASRLCSCQSHSHPLPRGPTTLIFPPTP